MRADMIRMILADDEPVITRGIRKLIDWESLGIEIIGEYEDGRRALEASRKGKAGYCAFGHFHAGVVRSGDLKGMPGYGQ